jgi:CRISPR-associated exonuclease Cas4
MHNITMESESELVALGKLLQETYSEGEEKDIVLDEISLDIVRSTREIVEIKRSKQPRDEHFMQVKYYLYYLQKKHGITGFTGKITYPRIHRTYEVILGHGDIEMLEKDIADIVSVFNMGSPPPPMRKLECSGCSYFDLCFA